MTTENEELKSFYESLKKEKGYEEPEKKETSNQSTSERDLFRVLVGEDGLVKQIVTINK